MTAQPGPHASPLGTHYLLTVLGKSARPANYALHGDGHTVVSPLAPLALLALLPPNQKPTTVVALCTDEAEAESFPLLQDNLPDSCKLERVMIPSGHSQDDINTFLTKATEAIPLGEAGAVRISLDVTHGFRHFSFLTYIAGLYLVGLRNIELAGAWYGLLQEGTSPFLDLRPLLEFPRWIHALQVLRDTGNALPLADTIKEGLNDQSANTIAKELRLISEAYLSALPLELGHHVGQFRSQRLKAMTGLVRNQHQLPLAKELVTGLDRLLHPFTLDTSKGGKGWKKTVALTPEELQRQALLIDGLFLHKDEAMALGLLDEWTVSWALWCLDTPEQWLNFRSKRRHAASQLGAIASACQKPALKALLTPEQRALGDFWHLLTNLRNGFHHHGMREEEIVGNSKTAGELKRVKTYWSDTLRVCPRLSLQVGESDGGALLVSPIGHRPGVLYSALLACRERIGAEPSACLVICSSESADAISTAASQAGFCGRISQLVLEDPYGGYQEFPRLRQEAQAAFLQADEVLVNVTGGTTLMGLAAQELETLARTFARPIQRFGLIDRRPSDEQVADPYKPGGAFWLQDAQEEP